MCPIIRTWRILAIMAATLVIVFVVLLVLRPPKAGYKLSPAVFLSQTADRAYEISPEKVAAIVLSQDARYQLIDVRSPSRYHQGMIGLAVNVPSYQILEKKYRRLFEQCEKDSLIILLYGDNQREALQPWMLLTQLGCRNLKMMTGGYLCFTGSVKPCLPEETVRYDVRMLRSTATWGQEQDAGSKTAEPVVPVKRKKRTMTEGGC